MWKIDENWWNRRKVISGKNDQVKKQKLDQKKFVDGKFLNQRLKNWELFPI